MRRTFLLAVAWALFLVTVATIATMVFSVRKLRAEEASAICPQVETVMPLLEVLGYELKLIAHDAGRSQTNGIFLHQSDHQRLFVSCRDGSAKLFRKAGE